MSCVLLVIQPPESECTLPACSQMQDPPWKADAAALAALELFVQGHMLPTPLAAAANGGELQLPSVCLKTADIERCKPGMWLNDELINFGMWRLQQRDAAIQGGNSKWPELDAFWQGQQHVSCHFFNSYFLAKYYLDRCAVRYDEVRRWTWPQRLQTAGQCKPGVLDCELLVAPCNLGNRHWVLVVADLPRQRILYLDPMGVSQQAISAD